MKKFVWLATFIFVFLFSTEAEAEVSIEEIYPVTINVENKTYNKLNEGFIYYDRTYLRSDLIRESLKLQGEALEQERFLLWGENYHLELPLDRPGGNFNGEALPMEYFVKMRDGYIYYPLRLVAQLKKYDVEWNNEERTVNCILEEGTTE